MIITVTIQGENGEHLSHGFQNEVSVFVHLVGLDTIEQFPIPLQVYDHENDCTLGSVEYEITNEQLASSFVRQYRIQGIVDRVINGHAKEEKNNAS